MTYQVGDTVRYKASTPGNGICKITDIHEHQGVKWITLCWMGFTGCFREADFLESYEVVEDENA